MKNAIEKTKTKIGIYFLVSFWKTSRAAIPRINNISGILLPDIIIAEKKTINNNGIKNLIIFFVLMLKKIGNKKNENKENLCK